MVTELSGPIPDGGKALRLKALSSNSIVHEPVMGADTEIVLLPAPYPVIIMVVPEIAHGFTAPACDRETPSCFSKKNKEHS